MTDYERIIRILQEHLVVSQDGPRWTELLHGQIANAIMEDSSETYGVVRANEADPLKVGDRVEVTFDNGVVSAIRGDQVRVGSARFYGGGWFEASKVSKS